MAFNKVVFVSLTEELTARIARIARQVGAHKMTMWLYDRASREFDVPISYNLKYPDSFADLRNRPLRDGFAARIVADGKPRIEVDLTRNETLNVPFVRREGIKGFIGLPMIHGETTVGIVFFNFRKPSEVTPDTLNRCIEYAALLGAVAVASGVFNGDPVAPPDDITRESVLTAVVHTICGTLRKPVVLWLIDSPRSNRRLRVGAATGVRIQYLDLTADVETDNTVVTEVVRTGKPMLVPDISKEPRFRGKEFAKTDGWRSSAYFPIFSRGQCVGVFEVFYFDSLPERAADFVTLERLATIATISIQNFERSHEAQRIRMIAQEISAKPDIRNALATIAEGAKDLTSADCSSILLCDKKAETFEFETHVPANVSFDTARVDLETIAKQVVLSKEKHVRVGLKGIPAGLAQPPFSYRSFIGISVSLEDDLVGMFGVFSQQADEFTVHDAHLLHMLASQVSVALGWVQRLLRPTIAVDKATAGLTGQDDELREICSLVTKLGYDYAAVQLVRPDKRVIKTDLSLLKPRAEALLDWSGRSGHYLSPSPDLRDIQADIVLKAEDGAEASVEVIAGWDPRFDEWIYEKYNHKGLTRIFVPILIVRDESNRVVENWMTHCRWIATEARPNYKQGAELTSEPAGYCTAYRKLLPGRETKRWHFEVLGTVEAGYQALGKLISQDDVEELTRLVTSQGQKLRKTRVIYVFETIMKHARQIVNSHAATLHYNFTAVRPDGSNGYRYNCSDGLDWDEFHNRPPRTDGIGRQAIKAKKPIFRPDFSAGETEADYERYHPKMHEQGYRTTGAFPFFVDNMDGVLYLHFKQSHQFAPDEEEWIKLFVNKAADAIRHATSYTRMRDTENQLTTLNSVFQSLVRTPLAGSTLREIAWNALNMLAADVVTIYEYEDVSTPIIGEPIRAGRLIQPKKATDAMVPLRVIREGKDFYATNALDDPILGRPGRRGDGLCFVEREKIASSCAVILRAGDETVGVIFLNYRRTHMFPQEEQKLIAMLASSTAIAIQNRRSLELLVDVGKKLVEAPDLDQLLQFILILSVKATRAELAEVWLVDRFSREIECVRCLVRSGITVPDPCRRRMALDKSIVGRVACFPKDTTITCKPVDLTLEPYKTLTRSLVKASSVMCLALMDGDRAVGIINLESRQTGAFNELDSDILQSLADHAVVAVKNQKSQKKAAADDALANLGVTETGLHHCREKAAWIREDAANLRRDMPNETVNTYTLAIEQNANNIITEAEDLERFIKKRMPVLVEMPGIMKEVLTARPTNARVKLSHTLPAIFPPVMCNEFLLTNVFSILVHNALDAMPEGGVLTVTYHEVDSLQETGNDYVGVSVSDTGVGIKPELHERIFDLGYSTKGSGFGLWWARAQIRRLEGDITLTSTPNKGTTFRVVLPVSMTPQAEIDT